MGKKIWREPHKLTDNYIKGLRQKPPASGDRIFVPSKDRPRVKLCVTGTVDAKTGLAYASFLHGPVRPPGSRNPTFLLLGTVDGTTIEDAHNKSDAWTKLLAKGVDPRDERVRLADEAKKAKKAEAD